jgi:hypothetical protein
MTILVKPGKGKLVVKAKIGSDEFKTEICNSDPDYLKHMK